MIVTVITYLNCPLNILPIVGDIVYQDDEELTDVEHYHFMKWYDFESDRASAILWNRSKKGKVTKCGPLICGQNVDYTISIVEISEF